MANASETLGALYNENQADSRPGSGGTESLSHRESETRRNMFLQPIAKHIDRRRPDRFVPYARNALTHSDAQVAQIAASLVECRFRRQSEETGAL
jgi:hypothetical protein